MPAENEFGGRVALVTGAAGAAIGSTTCRTLASYGAGIVVLDNHERRTHETAEALREAYDVPVMAAVADIGDREHMAKTMDRGVCRDGVGGHLGEQRGGERSGQHLRLQARGLGLGDRRGSHCLLVADLADHRGDAGSPVGAHCERELRWPPIWAATVGKGRTPRPRPPSTR